MSRDLRGQREDDMEVRHRQQLGFARASIQLARLGAPWHFEDSA